MPSLSPPPPLSPSFWNSLFCLLHKPESRCFDSAFAHLALPAGPVHSLHYSGHMRALQTICGSRNTLLESPAFRTAQEFKATVQMTASLCFFTLRNTTTNPGRRHTNIAYGGDALWQGCGGCRESGESRFSPVSAPRPSPRDCLADAGWWPRPKGFSCTQHPRLLRAPAATLCFFYVVAMPVPLPLPTRFIGGLFL